LCFCAAIIEGIDLQSMGIAASGIAPEFHLSKEALGAVLTASPLGLFFGAFIGGRLADFWGRRNALILSIVVFGAFQLATAWATGYSSLIAIRFLCGLGLGGAFPNQSKVASLFGLLVMAGLIPAALARKDVPKAAPAITDVLKGP
jgi:AAHS family 3-hydroxyphenylpropionic acid transporter